MRVRTESLLFRALVLASLIFAACTFSLNQDKGTRSKQYSEDAGPKNTEVGAPKTFGAKLVDDPTATFTAALALLTAVLAGVGVAQIFYLRRTDETARKSAEAALTSARVAELSLVGADAPFVFPVPRAFDKKIDPPPPSPTDQGFACYCLHNYGKSPAIVREVYHDLRRSKAIPRAVKFPPPQTNLFIDNIIGPDQDSTTWRFREGAILSINPGGVVFLSGQVRFTDVLGNYFITGFCYAYRSPDKFFYAIGGTTHNYQRRLTSDEQEVAAQRDMRNPKN